MNRNDRTLAGLAWLAATMPTLVRQDCINGDEINDVSAMASSVTMHFTDYQTAARVAARLGLDVSPNFGGDSAATSESTWWIGKHHLDGIEVRVVTLDPPQLIRPCDCDDPEHTCRALYGRPNRAHVPTEFMDEVTA